MMLLVWVMTLVDIRKGGQVAPPAVDQGDRAKFPFIRENKRKRQLENFILRPKLLWTTTHWCLLLKLVLSADILIIYDGKNKYSSSPTMLEFCWCSLTKQCPCSALLTWDRKWKRWSNFLSTLRKKKMRKCLEVFSQDLPLPWVEGKGSEVTVYPLIASLINEVPFL